MTTKTEKMRRMAVRKAISDRKIDKPKVKSRVPVYLVAHACFDCRVSFKRKPREVVQPCPNCLTPLHEMGRSFKAPRKQDVEQWKKVEQLRRAGFRFPTSSTDAPAYPEKLKDVEKFIRENPSHPYRFEP